MSSYMNIGSKNFLYELANLRDSSESVKRFEARFAGFLPWADLQNTTTIDVVSLPEQIPAVQVNRFEMNMSNHRLFELRDALRLVWSTRDLREKEWRAFLFRADPTMGISFLLEHGLPSRSLFDDAVMYLFKRVRKMEICQNPECPACYFWATKRGQKYCSEVCAGPAQKSYKRRWWQKHGREWRRRRMTKRKRNSTR